MGRNKLLLGIHLIVVFNFRKIKMSPLYYRTALTDYVINNSREFSQPSTNFRIRFSRSAPAIGTKKQAQDSFPPSTYIAMHA